MKCVKKSAKDRDEKIFSWAGYLLSHYDNCLSHMEDGHIFKKIPIDISHLPTLMLPIGYAVYWVELYLLRRPYGVTSPLATVLFALPALWIIGQNSRNIVRSVKEAWSGFCSLDGGRKIIFGACGISAAFLLAGSFYVSLFPPHLIQEYDALNYHYALPRQHLIWQSFRHLPWSTADLFVMPIQFALAPFWLVTQLPNKFPQFLFLLGALAVSANLVKKFSGRPGHAAIILFAIVGSHCMSIQMGTAMLDIVLCYLFLASLDSLLRGHKGLALMEFAFFFWSKSFMPFLTGFIFAAIGILYYGTWRIGRVQLKWDFIKDVHVWPRKQILRELARAGTVFVILSLILAGPFMAKSISQTGTPFYPFGVGINMVAPGLAKDPAVWETFLKATQANLAIRDDYGYGRSWLAFIKHFWLLAVPDKGVNNEFDYPLGLVYLLFLGPFVYETAKAFREKNFPLLPLTVIIYWFFWWMGSQQSRFLFIPVLLMYIVTLASLEKISKVLAGALLVALCLNALSFARAHKNDLGLGREAVLRHQDKVLVQMSREYRRQGRNDVVFLEKDELTYAQFPVILTRDRFPFVVGRENE